MKELLRQIDSCTKVYRDTETGIAWVEDGRSGCGHSAHPNIDATGSVAGMKNKGYWEKSDRTVSSHGFIYNIDMSVVSDELDELAKQHCQCGGKH